jgi:hypothetical protein
MTTEFPFDKRRQDQLLAEMLADIEAMSDAEILAEYTEEGVDVEAEAASVASVVDAALRSFQANRLEQARQAAAAARQQRTSSNVIQFPLQRKRAILAAVQAAANDQVPLTIAARNGDQEELDAEDIDGLLLDLVRLGMIDDDGNLV